MTDLPKPIGVLLAAYFAASLLHFAHNAEFVAFYPGMPPWLTRETVYLAWLAIALALASILLAWRSVPAPSSRT